MKNSTPLILSKTDYERLSSLIRNLDGNAIEFLENELERAKIVETREIPDDVVAMNTVVRFRNIDTGSEMIVTLVYPSEANVEAGKISVLAPVGAALIGLRVGQSIRWPLPDGRERTLEVMSVTPRNLREIA